MKIAVLSGKGGTGKTFISTNLAAITHGSVYVDCDVEEPNGRLFLPCQNPEKKEVCVLLPSFDREKCVGCRACVRFCGFNALAFIGNLPKVFKEVCHSCGGCKLVCPENAVTETQIPIGVVEIGVSNGVRVVTGEMNIGEASGVPVIRQALAEALSMEAPLTVIDCPPGSACTVTESISAADYCIMVAEPTMFGLHNLRMVIELTRAVEKPCGVVINKDEGVFPALEAYCQEQGIPILSRIPYRKDFASYISKGKLLVEESEEARSIFTALKTQIGEA